VLLLKRDLSVNLGNLLLSLSEVTDIANPSITQHQHRTAFIALQIADHIKISNQLLENIFTAALLHDIGAISIEEKTELQNYLAPDYDLHCIRGELLFEQTPWLKSLSKIVRNHHKNWSEWNTPINDPETLASQVILLADFIERSIDKQQYILFQTDDIIAKINGLKDHTVNSELISAFLDLSRKEEFWLDLSSPRIYSILLNQEPFRNNEIDLNGIANIAELFCNIIDFKSRFTSTHTSGVAACAEKMAELFGLTDIEILLMRIAGYLHDIGKLVIPNSILEKPDKLTPAEFAIIKCHTYYTYYVLNSIGGLQTIAKWAAYHHEKLNGSGYPFHCKSNEIDTGARIMAVADIFTAVAEDRPYRAGMGKDDIYRVLTRQADDGCVDPRFVNLLFDNYDTIYNYVREKQKAAHRFYEEQFTRIQGSKNGDGS